MIPGYRHSLLALAVLGLAQPALADVITDWNEKALALVQPRVPFIQVYRARAMIHVAMFDAVNSIEHRYRPYFVQFTATPQTSKEAAAAAAASAVLAGLLRRGDVNTASAATWRRSRTDAKDDGIRLGEMVRGQILEARATTVPDAGQPSREATPGSMCRPLRRWRRCGRTCARSPLTGPAQFRPEPPPKWTPPGGWPTTTRSRSSAARPAPNAPPKQTEDARFWLMTRSPYDPIVRQVVGTRQMRRPRFFRFMALRVGRHGGRHHRSARCQVSL